MHCVHCHSEEESPLPAPREVILAGDCHGPPVTPYCRGAFVCCLGGMQWCPLWWAAFAIYFSAQPTLGAPEHRTSLLYQFVQFCRVTGSNAAKKQKIALATIDW